LQEKDDNRSIEFLQLPAYMLVDITRPMLIPALDAEAGIAARKDVVAFDRRWAHQITNDRR